MDEQNNQIPECENAIIEDTVTLPRAEYDLLRDAVSTLKAIRTLYSAGNISKYNAEDAAYALIFPEKVLPLKENSDA